MEEIRINNDEENILLKIKFQLPPILHGIFIFLIAINFIALFLVIETPALIWSVAGSLLFVALVYILMGCTVFFSECIITDKEIMGKQFFIFGMKTYHYKFDLIYSIESVKWFGLVNNIVIKFSQGSIFEKIVRPKLVLNFVDDCDKVQKKLKNILDSVKSDKNLFTSLANQQSQALAYIGDSIQSANNSKKNNTKKSS